MTEEAVWRPLDPVDCPQCRQPAGLEIAYGMPGHDLLEAAENGQLVLGGCVIFPGQPDFRCRACGHEWVVDEEP